MKVTINTNTKIIEVYGELDLNALKTLTEALGSDYKIIALDQMGLPYYLPDHEHIIKVAPIYENPDHFYPYYAPHRYYPTC